MAKGSRKLNVIFRVIVFATFAAAMAASILFLNFGMIVAEDSFSSFDMFYSENNKVISMVIQSCVCYFVMTGLAAAAFIFSIICFKCTSIVASVFRTIIMGLTVVVDAMFVSAVIAAYQVMQYVNGNTDFYSVIMNNTMINNDTFEEEYMAAIVFMFLTAAVYFVFSITSIISLAVKPAPKNMGYQQQVMYGQAPNMPYGQAQNMQYGQTPNMPYGQAPNMQYGQTPNMQYGQAPNMQYGQAQNMQYGQVQTDAKAQQPTDTQSAAQPKIVGYDAQTGAPIYENQQN